MVSGVLFKNLSFRTMGVIVLIEDKKKYPDDLSGLKFGTLTVICRAANHANDNSMWLCECDCGRDGCRKIVVKRRGNLTRKDYSPTCGLSRTATHNAISRSAQKNSSTGYNGVSADSKHPGKYRARICFQNKRLNMGNLTLDEAIKVRQAWDKMLKSINLSDTI